MLVLFIWSINPAYENTYNKKFLSIQMFVNLLIFLKVFSTRMSTCGKIHRFFTLFVKYLRFLDYL